MADRSHERELKEIDIVVLRSVLWLHNRRDSQTDRLWRGPRSRASRCKASVQGAAPSKPSHDEMKENDQCRSKMISSAKVALTLCSPFIAAATGAAGAARPPETSRPSRPVSNSLRTRSSLGEPFAASERTIRCRTYPGRENGDNARIGNDTETLTDGTAVRSRSV